MMTYQLMCCLVESFFLSWVTPMVIVTICTLKFLVIPCSRYILKLKKVNKTYKRNQENLNTENEIEKYVPLHHDPDVILSTPNISMVKKRIRPTVLKTSQHLLETSMISTFGTPISAQNTWKTVQTKVRTEVDKENFQDLNDSYNYFNSLGCSEEHDMSFVSGQHKDKKVSRRTRAQPLKVIHETVDIPSVSARSYF